MGFFGVTQQVSALACCTIIPVPMVVVVVIRIPSTSATTTAANILDFFIAYSILQK
jgi:hypothetical protein